MARTMKSREIGGIRIAHAKLDETNHKINNTT